MSIGGKVWSCEACEVESEGPDKERDCWFCGKPMTYRIASVANEVSTWEISAAKWRAQDDPERVAA